MPYLVVLELIILLTRTYVSLIAGLLLLQVFEQCAALQKEVAVGVQELKRCQKTYNEDEHVAHDVRVKANDAESKCVSDVTSRHLLFILLLFLSAFTCAVGLLFFKD